MSLNPKTLLIGMVAAVLLGVGAFSMANQTSAHLQVDDLGGCASADADTVANLACVGVVDLSNSNLHDQDLSCWDAVPSQVATFSSGVIGSLTVLSRSINDIVPICVQHNSPPTSATGAVGFDANDVGRWLTIVCPQVGGSAADFEFTTSSVVTNTAWNGPDECANIVGKGDDFTQVPGTSVAYLAFYQCPPVSAVANITIDHDGQIFSFSISCLGAAAQATIGVSPSTVEIIPAPGNQSYSRVTVTVADALGNRLDGVEVDFITDNCFWQGEVAVDGVTITPRGGLDANVRTHVSFSDTDLGGSSNQDNQGRTQDQTYVATQLGIVNPNFTSGNIGTNGVPIAAGTAEAILQCFPSDQSAFASLVKPGPANIQAIVRRTGTNVCPIGQTPGAGTNVLISSTTALCNPVAGFANNLLSSANRPFGFEDIILTATVTVIGPPASITVAASPTSLRCGEKSTITATVKDALGANVSDHTRVELITNLGGVIAGTGAVTAGLGAGVVPISSSVAETFAGVATAFLLTSEVTTGPYEVVVTTGGSYAFNTNYQIPSLTGFGDTLFDQDGGLGDVGSTGGNLPAGTIGVFSTAPVSAQTTVTCALPTPAAPPAPEITAPRTGTGITPPSTGDAGLADSSSSSSALFAIGTLVAFAIAGVVTLKFARR